jgi:DNA-binding MarR family transcriptional regulator
LDRRARFYSITPAGRRQLAAATKNWNCTVDVLSRMLAQEP